MGVELLTSYVRCLISASILLLLGWARDRLEARHFTAQLFDRHGEQHVQSSAWKSGKWNKQVLKENNLILHAHLQGSMCQAAVCTEMERCTLRSGWVWVLFLCTAVRLLFALWQTKCVLGTGSRMGQTRCVDTLSKMVFSEGSGYQWTESERPGLVQLLT